MTLVPWLHTPIAVPTMGLPSAGYTDQVQKHRYLRSSQKLSPQMSGIWCSCFLQSGPLNMLLKMALCWTRMDLCAPMCSFLSPRTNVTSQSCWLSSLCLFSSTALWGEDYCSNLSARVVSTADWMATANIGEGEHWERTEMKWMETEKQAGENETK